MRALALALALGAAAPAAAETVESKLVSGLGTVEVRQDATLGQQRWTLAILREGHPIVSIAIDLPGDDCGAGHCNATTVTPRLRIIHPRRRVTAALELRAIEVWYQNGPGGKTYRTVPIGHILACGASGNCRTFDAEGCPFRLRDDGTITSVCTTTLDPDPQDD
jgi:hypothetical protein